MLGRAGALGWRASHLLGIVRRQHLTFTVPFSASTADAQGGKKAGNFFLYIVPQIQAWVKDGLQD